MSKSWMVIAALFICLLPQIIAAQQTSNSNSLITGEKDFDFEIGAWKTSLKRLQNPLSGSTNWNPYEGVTIVRKVWNGKANMVELNVKGLAGKIQGLSLRLFNPITRQWSLHFANSKDGNLAIPAVGQFKDGRGEFYNEDSFKGKKIIVRFIISSITANDCHFEQAFSDDNGKTWEVNWIADDRRLKTKVKGARNPGPKVYNR